jgi:hypothetical protein
MTGYLQRLAASAARPSPSLHPLVGSIFSGGQQEAVAPDLLQNDALASAYDENLVPATRTVSDMTDDPMRRGDLPTDDRVEQHARIALPIDNRQTEQRRGEREILHPLLPSKTPEMDVSAMPSASRDVASAESTLQHDRPNTSSFDSARMAQVPVEDGPTADQRNATAPPPASGFRERAGRLAVVTNDSGKPVRAEFSAPSRRSTQSDDIQIHIGRIEVTAVAQPAPRPAAAPARKAMSLDEYLGRGRRGAR